MKSNKAAKILAKRKAAKIDPNSLFDPNFPHQTAFIHDPARLKALFCTRRAAKSYTAGLYMVYEALTNPGANCLFIGLTRLSALGIIWKDILKDINRRFGLKAKFNESNLTMTLSNGSVILVTGADSSEEEMLKLLGRKYRLVCLDEASMYTVNLHTMVYGILKPATIDQGGTICMMGTASNFTKGLFYDITTLIEPGWKLFTWSALDNPHVAKQFQDELDEIDRERPLFKETPLYKQFYLNQWVVDADKLVYKFNPDKNLFDELPKNLNPTGWTYTLGVDLGWEDDSAFVVSAFHENDPHLYIIETFNKPKMTFDQVTDKVHDYLRSTDRPISKVIIDGANKQGVESMRQRSSIPFEYADKTGKVDFIEMLNGDFIQAKIKVHRSCTILINELMGLVWKTIGDKIMLPKKEHPSLSNHLCDALLYNWRMSYHWMSAPATKIVPKFSKEWYNQQAEGIWEREKEMLQKQQEMSDSDIPWRDDDGFGSYS